jgi:hypothetical protein
MPQPQFVPSPLKIIERRRCQNCGARMLMTGAFAQARGCIILVPQ